MACAVLIDDGGGARPWLVMVHGMSQDHRYFSEQVAAFRSAFRLLLVDLPGHGLSAAIGGPFGHVELARHVREVLDAYGVSQADYWGTHTGATVGLLLAVDHPARFRSLILEGPVVPGRNPPIVATLIERAKESLRQHGLQTALDVWWRTSCWFDQMRANPEACRAQAHFDMIKDFAGQPWHDAGAATPVLDIEDRLARLRCPTLIYNGTLDHPDFLLAADEIAGLLGAGLSGNVQQQSIPNSGGFPAWEAPQLVNDVVRQFLAGMQSGRSAFV